MCILLSGQFQMAQSSDGAPIMDLGIFTWLQYQKKQFFTDIVEIAIKDKAVNSPEVTVSIFEPILFENQDKTNHRIVFLPGIGNAMDFEVLSPVIKPGERWGLEIHIFGVMTYQCTLHPEEHGTITVKL